MSRMTLAVWQVAYAKTGMRNFRGLSALNELASGGSRRPDKIFEAQNIRNPTMEANVKKAAVEN
jgi:hypothetical protein